MNAQPSSTSKVRVWDLPTRVFHWSLALCVTGAIVSAKIGDEFLAWHMRLGYAVLALLLFRLVWGFAGSHYARFANFPPSVQAARAYLRGGSTVHGHNPLGAFSVYLLLAVFLLQALTGLFTNDDISWEGPLRHLASERVGDLLSQLHHVNQLPMYVLLALHLGAIAFYARFRRLPLVPAMLSGDQPARTPNAVSAQDTLRLRLIGLCVFAAMAAAVGLLVSFA